MAKTKVVEAKIDILIPDDLNANKGTEFGEHLIDMSFRTLGAGRSVLLDKNNRLIAGNKSTLKCAEIGIDDVIIVETDGTKLVAVKRTDIDLDSEKGRELALADNATSKANLDWDTEALTQIQEQWDITPKDWGIKLPKMKALEEEEENEHKVLSTTLTVECSTVEKLQSLFMELQERGFKVTTKE